MILIILIPVFKMLKKTEVQFYSFHTIRFYCFKVYALEITFVILVFILNIHLHMKTRKSFKVNSNFTFFLKINLIKPKAKKKTKNKQPQPQTLLAKIRCTVPHPLDLCTPRVHEPFLLPCLHNTPLHLRTSALQTLRCFLVHPSLHSFRCLSTWCLKMWC